MTSANPRVTASPPMRNTTPISETVGQQVGRRAGDAIGEVLGKVMTYLVEREIRMSGALGERAAERRSRMATGTPSVCRDWWRAGETANAYVPLTSTRRSMNAKETDARRAAPLHTPTDLCSNATRDVSAALNLRLADVFAPVRCDWVVERDGFEPEIRFSVLP